MRASYLLTIVFFVFAGFLWLIISTLNFKSRRQALVEEMEASGLGDVSARKGKTSYLSDVGYGILGFGESIWVGAKLVLLNRQFVCESFNSHFVIRSPIHTPFQGCSLHSEPSNTSRCLFVSFISPVLLRYTRTDSWRIPSLLPSQSVFFVPLRGVRSSLVARISAKYVSSDYQQFPVLRDSLAPWCSHRSYLL